MKSKTSSGALILLFAAAYFTSYLSRANYGTVISEMITATGYSKEMLSMAVTGSFFTYGLGQIVSGFLGDQISPKKLLACGLGVTASMNLLLPLCKKPWQMAVVWSINGFAQAFMWPPLVKLMTVLLPERDYQKGVLWVSYGSGSATILLYLISPLLIAWMGWKSVFVVAAAVAVLMLVAWLRLCPNPGKVQSKTPETEYVSGGRGRLFSSAMLGIMLAIILHGMLKDGVATWMPNYISETYDMDNLLAILSGVLMPVLSMVSVKAGALLYRKKFTNPVACAACVFGISTATALILVLVNGSNAISSILLMAMLTGSMHAVNLMLISTIPPFFKKYGMVSTASGVLNACTYVGSAVSAYGIAALSENLGWSFTLWGWVLIAMCAAGLCALCARHFQKIM